MTGRVDFHRWAAELAVAAHAGFTVRGPGGVSRMVWKTSIDLSRPLVPSMGHHDPLDALLTCLDVDTAPADGEESVDVPRLGREIAEAAALCQGADWTTQDALGIGGLLVDCARLARMVAERGVGRRGLLAKLLADARASLAAFTRTGALSLPAAHRLGFRELGLSIGLRAVERLPHWLEPGGELAAAAEPLRPYLPLAHEIESFWADPAHRRAATWTEHQDINEVMLATSLAPEGYLGG